MGLEPGVREMRGKLERREASLEAVVCVESDLCVLLFRYKVDFIEEKASQNPERIVKLHR